MDYYKILDLPSNANKDEIRAAYKKMVRISHRFVAKCLFIKIAFVGSEVAPR